MMHLFALVKDGRETAVQRVNVNRQVRRELESLFAEQSVAFIGELDQVTFEGSYSVDESEIFIIEEYALAQSLSDAIRNPQECEEFQIADAPMRLISLFGGDYNEDGDSVSAYFQAFNKARLLQTGWTLLQRRNTFQKLDDPGVTLDTKIVVAFEAGTLFFKKYATANRIVDISNYFREANDQEVREVLGHERLFVDDEDAVLNICDGWMRKRFSLLMQSNVLDDVGPRRIANVARKYDIEFQTSRNRNGDQLVFPTKKREMKEMLTFLNEGYYEGELTGTRFQTNSNRVLDD